MGLYALLLVVVVGSSSIRCRPKWRRMVLFSLSMEIERKNESRLEWDRFMSGKEEVHTTCDAPGSKCREKIFGMTEFFYSDKMILIEVGSTACVQETIVIHGIISVFVVLLFKPQRGKTSHGSLGQWQAPPPLH